MSLFKEYRKKPISIHAVQWDGTAETASEIIQFIQDNGHRASYHCDAPEGCERDGAPNTHTIRIHTLEGDMDTSPQDYVIQGTKGEFYPCKPDIFENIHEMG